MHFLRPLTPWGIVGSFIQEKNLRMNFLTERQLRAPPAITGRSARKTLMLANTSHDLKQPLLVICPLLLDDLDTQTSPLPAADDGAETAGEQPPFDPADRLFCSTLTARFGIDTTQDWPRRSTRSDVWYSARVRRCASTKINSPDAVVPRALRWMATCCY